MEHLIQSPTDFLFSKSARAGTNRNEVDEARHTPPVRLARGAPAGTRRRPRSLLHSAGDVHMDEPGMEDFENEVPYPPHEAEARARFARLTQPMDDASPLDCPPVAPPLSGLPTVAGLQWPPADTTATRYQAWMATLIGAEADPRATAAKHAEFALELLDTDFTPLCISAVMNALRLDAECALAEAVRAELNRRAGDRTADLGFARALSLNPNLKSRIEKWRAAGG